MFKDDARQDVTGNSVNTICVFSPAFLISRSSSRRLSVSGYASRLPL